MSGEAGEPSRREPRRPEAALSEPVFELEKSVDGLLAGAQRVHAFALAAAFIVLVYYHFERDVAARQLERNETLIASIDTSRRLAGNVAGALRERLSRDYAFARPPAVLVADLLRDTESARRRAVALRQALGAAEGLEDERLASIRAALVRLEAIWYFGLAPWAGGGPGEVPPLSGADLSIGAIEWGERLRELELDATIRLLYLATGSPARFLAEVPRPAELAATGKGAGRGGNGGGTGGAGGTGHDAPDRAANGVRGTIPEGTLGPLASSLATLVAASDTVYQRLARREAAASWTHFARLEQSLSGVDSGEIDPRLREFLPYTLASLEAARDALDTESAQLRGIVLGEDDIELPVLGSRLSFRDADRLLPLLFGAVYFSIASHLSKARRLIPLLGIGTVWGTQSSLVPPAGASLTTFPWTNLVGLALLVAPVVMLALRPRPDIAVDWQLSVLVIGVLVAVYQRHRYVAASRARHRHLRVAYAGLHELDGASASGTDRHTGGADASAADDRAAR